MSSWGCRKPCFRGAHFRVILGSTHIDVDFHPTLQEDIIIGINCPHATHHYRYVTNDVYHNSAIAPANITGGGANNDVVELRRNGGKYQAVVYQAGGAEHILFEKEVSDLDGDPFDDYTFENLYPVIFFGAGDTNLILSTPRVHLTPYDIVIPYEIQLLNPIISHINIFSFIKKVEHHKKTLIVKYKDVKNEIRYTMYKWERENEVEADKKQDDVSRLQKLFDRKEEIKTQLIQNTNNKIQTK